MYTKITQSMREKAKLHRSYKRAQIAESLYEQGIIDSKAQLALYDGEKIRQAVNLYTEKCLKAEKEKKSTGVVGKYLDVANRALKAINHGSGIKIEDLSCRDATLPDITVAVDEKGACNGKSSIQVEMKSGAGELARADDLGACYDIIASACERGKWICWYYDVDGFNAFAPDALDNVDYLPHIFLPLAELLERLEGYKGEIDTWLREPSANSVNFQTVSAKKKKYLAEVAAESYDWPRFRDFGRIVKQCE